MRIDGRHDRSDERPGARRESQRGNGDLPRASRRWHSHNVRRVLGAARQPAPREEPMGLVPELPLRDGSPDAILGWGSAG